jgi:hypothetical protein
MTLAEAKRRLQVGTFVVMTYHKFNKTPLVNVTRVVAKKQTNAVAFVFPATPGSRLSWLWWPKASEFKSDSDNEFSILDENGEIFMSYKILERRD